MGLFGDLVNISKPRIMTLLLVVAWASMFLADGGFPSLSIFLAVTVAGVLSTASSGAFNQILERKLDARMGRTSERPIASGRLSVTTATAYAVATGALSGVLLLVFGANLAAYLTWGAIAFYVVLYTVLLKPNTPQNIVIGGFAGSFPALIGWSAVTGGLAWPAWMIALIVFFWTPPHFWALALLYKEDYEAAEFPMMPTIHGEKSTKRQIVLYAVLALLVSLSIIAWPGVGYLYAVLAVYLGVKFVSGAVGLLKTEDRQVYRKYFLFSIQYLGLLLLGLLVDQILVALVPQASIF